MYNKVINLTPDSLENWILMLSVFVFIISLLASFANSKSLDNTYLNNVTRLSYCKNCKGYKIDLIEQIYIELFTFRKKKDRVRYLTK